MFKRIFVIIIIITTLAAGGLYYLYYSGELQRLAVGEANKRLATQIHGADTNLLNEILGFDKPKTVLLLFLNNTELRPGGGFIGSYAVIKVDRGTPQVVKVEGTEILDNLAPKDMVSVPPAPLKDYLKVSKWYFRDSNWSPDFALSSQKSLELYKLENGVEANNIDLVIGFTPTVIEEILKISGPITAGGLTLNSENFTEKLEYEVEYGYDKKNLDFSERKKILGELVPVLIDKIKSQMLWHYSDYWRLGNDMLSQKQVMIYALNPVWQKIIETKDWAGTMKSTKSDYLMWVDANLGALKTDLKIDRNLSYQISPSSSGRFLARATMDYSHHGSFDWRTTRYRTYARVFVPVGSTLVKTEGVGVTTTDSGVENGRQWFGAFIVIDPGKNKSLTFEYNLPDTVSAQIKSGQYSLSTQKQAGSLATKLTLGLDFGKKVISAEPAEASEKFGDNRFDYSTDLSIDREFKAAF